MNALAQVGSDVIDAAQARPLAGQPAFQPSAVATPAALVQMAVQNGASMEQLEKLLALQERWEAGEARKAFTAAMAAFKLEPITIVKDKENKQYNSRYTSLGNLVQTVTPFLSKHGLSADWEIEQEPKLSVTCVLTHALGHSKRVRLDVPPDASGAKNAIQQIKSAITYAKSVTFESACGLASTDANFDDDGNAAGGVAAVTAVAGESIAAKMIEDFQAQLKACAGDSAAAALWATAGKALLATGDRKAYMSFRDQVVAHRTSLRDGGATNV